MVDLTENTGARFGPDNVFADPGSNTGGSHHDRRSVVPWSGDVAECSIGRLRLLKHASDRII
ncbi:hypothetical protein ABD71_18430 [Brevibacillus laterosporus]|nr:hypothetical protein [Brevibacillus laterosporus]